MIVSTLVLWTGLHCQSNLHVVFCSCMSNNGYTENWLSLVSVRINMLGLASTLYKAIPSFNNPTKEGLWKHGLKKEKMLLTNVFSFTNFLTYHKQILSFEPMCKMLSANALNVVNLWQSPKFWCW